MEQTNAALCLADLELPSPAARARARCTRAARPSFPVGTPEDCSSWQNQTSPPTPPPSCCATSYSKSTVSGTTANPRSLPSLPILPTFTTQYHSNPSTCLFRQSQSDAELMAQILLASGSHNFLDEWQLEEVLESSGLALATMV
jgi:hypothetical protein